MNDSTVAAWVEIEGVWHHITFLMVGSSIVPHITVIQDGDIRKGLASHAVYFDRALEYDEIVKLADKEPTT